MEKIISKLKALGDSNRFRIVMMLKNRPMCACELLEVLDIAGGTLSTHLKILKNAGLLDQKKDGRWIEYTLKDSGAIDLVNNIQNYIKDKDIINDDLNKIMNLDRTICSSKK